VTDGGADVHAGAIVALCGRVWGEKGYCRRPGGRGVVRNKEMDGKRFPSTPGSAALHPGLLVTPPLWG
jgi:hypothetical protein